MNNNYIELSFDHVVKSTPNAILFDMGEEEPTWIPISQIDTDEYDSNNNTVLVKEWWATEKGLI